MVTLNTKSMWVCPFCSFNCIHEGPPHLVDVLAYDLVYSPRLSLVLHRNLGVVLELRETKVFHFRRSAKSLFKLNVAKAQFGRSSFTRTSCCSGVSM